MLIRRGTWRQCCNRHTIDQFPSKYLPRKLINSEQKGAEPDKEQQPVSARTRSRGTPEEVLECPVSSRTRSHNAGAAILAVTGDTPDGKDTPGDDDMRTQSLDGPVASRTRSHDPKPDAAPRLMAVDTPAEEDDTIDSDDSSSDDDSRPEDPLVLHKSDSGITRHLKTNSECLSTLSKTDNLASISPSWHEHAMIFIRLCWRRYLSLPTSQCCAARRTM